MDLKEFQKKFDNKNLGVLSMKEGTKVKGTVIKRVESGVLVDCKDGGFTGVILPKEAKELERGGYDLSVGVELEAEVLSADIMDEEGYYTISISKLLQIDIWNNVTAKFNNDEVITVIPTEANLGGLLVDMHGIKGFIPLSQLAPVHYPRVEDGDQEKIFESLLSLVYKEFKVRIINIDEDGQRLILSEREALKEERDEIMNNLDIGNEYEGVISGVSSYGLFVTIGGGIEGLVHISEITYGHVDSIDRFGNVGDTVKVKVIGFEDGKISLSLKQLKPDPWSIIPQDHKIGDVVEGEVIRYVPYGLFIRVFDDINGLVHLSEVTDRPISNPAEVVKLGQKVKAKIILMDPSKRKIGLSMKALIPGAESKPAPKQDRKTEKKVKKEFKKAVKKEATEETKSEDAE